MCVDSSYVVDTVLLNISKVFDVAPHVLPLQKLKDVGVSAVLLNWILGFVTDLTIFVSVDGEPSSTREVLNGIPQGSVLGLLLFTGCKLFN